MEVAMFRVPALVTLLTISLFLHQSPSPKSPATLDKSEAPNPSAYKAALEHLYRLIWPLGQSKVDLPSAVSASTEKSAPASGIPQLYLLNTKTGALKSWPDTLGVSQFSVCPDSKTLFYSRDNGLYMESLQVSNQDVSILVPPKKVEGIELVRLYACIQDEKGGIALWAGGSTGSVRLLRLRQASASWEDLPHDDALAAFQPLKLAQDLGKLRSIRPDGFVAWVRNHQLLGQTSSSSQPSLLVDSDLPFSETPNWIGDSPFLFITASTPE
jgi:hypothetical protein